MMAEITYQMVLSTLQTLSLIVGMTYYLMILNNQQKNQKITLQTRKASYMTQLAFDLYSTESLTQYGEITSWEWENIEEYWSKYDTKECWLLWNRLFLRFDMVGRLLREGLIDTIDAVQVIGSASILLWNKFEKVTLEQRKRYGANWMSDFEYLANEVTKVYDQTYTSNLQNT
jgi:hypothetical protein